MTGSKRAPRRGLAILLAVSSGIASLAVAEAVLRIATPATFGQVPHARPTRWMVDDPLLGLSNRAGFEGRFFRINSHGFRGPELAAEPRHRIVCLGDSGTFGLWLEGDSRDPGRKYRRFDNYPEELTALLRASGLADVEVVNAGVVGHTSSHGLRLLIARVLELNPDIVTLRFGLNDHKLASARSGRRIAEPANPLVRHSLYALGDWRLTRLLLRSYRNAEWTRTYAHGNAPWVAPERFAGDLRRFAELSRSHGFQLVFLDYPLRPLAWGEHPHYVKIYRPSGNTSLADFYAVHERYQALVRRVAEEQDVPLLVTRAEFERNDPRRFSDWDFVHPNARGARELAEQLLGEFLARAWLPRPGDAAAR